MKHLRAQVPGRLARPGARAAALTALLAVIVILAAPAAVTRASDDQPTQWQIDARAEALQTAPPPAEKPVICIVDTGVTPTPDLDIVSRTALDGGTPDDVTARPGHYGHGTTVAHMAAGKVNGWGSSGVFPHARIASVRIFDDVNQRVPWQRYVSALDACSDVSPRPTVVVLSIGSPTATVEETARLRAAIGVARGRHGMIVVAAAGNSGGAAEMPARLDDAFSVAAANADGAVCAVSARGINVDIMAPGCGVSQSGWDGAAWRVDGTSFAAPLVAGVAAAIRAYRGRLDAPTAEGALISGARRGMIPLLDTRAAMLHVGLDWAALHGEPATDSAPPLSELVDSPALGVAGESAQSFVLEAEQPLASIARGVPTRREPVRLPVPRTTRRFVGRYVLITVLNRPAGAVLQLERADRLFVRRGNRIRVRRGRSIRLRFLAELGTSAWTRLSIRSRHH